MYKAFISLVLVAGASSAVVKSPLCPAGYFGNVMDPERCDAFYFCANELQLNLFCATGYEFDDYLKKCEPISTGGCTLGSVQPSKSAEVKDSAESAKSAESAGLICPDGFYGNIAHLELCSSFYMCIGMGAPILMNCAEGLEFDFESNDCLEISDGGCTLGSDETPKSAESTESAESAELAASICPDGVFGNMAHPDLCSSFYMCIGTGAPILMNCADGLEFDFESNICVTIADGGCTLGSVKPPKSAESLELAEAASSTCPDGFFGNIVHPKLCSSFYMCFGRGNPILMTCADGLEFDSVSNDCVEIVEGGCTVGSQVETERTVETNTNPTSPEPSFCPMEYFGNVPDPENCNAFYLCKGGFAIHLNCTTGFEFDDDLKICAEINENGCTSRS